MPACSCWPTPASTPRQFLAGVTGTGAQFLVRSGARRCPTPLRHLPDGSYLARIGYGVLPALITVRVIEAAVTVTLAGLLPAWRRPRTKPGTRKNRTSKYHPATTQSATSQTYTLNARIQFFSEGLAPRPRR